MNDRPKYAPKDHVALPRAKVGVLLANLGTPDDTSYWSMRRYLSEFLSDKRVVDTPNWKWQPILQLVILSFRPSKSGRAYDSIWNKEADESPLLTITRDQTDALRGLLTERYGDDVVVDFCMRYGNPSVESKIMALKKQGCEKIVFFPLYPQYAAPTTATANDAAFRALMKMNWQPSIRTVPAYFENPAYIEALATTVREAYAGDNPPQKLVVSYHGVPERYRDEGDPYYCQCLKSTRLLQEALGWDEAAIDTAFQSKFGPTKWVGPATVEHVAELAKAGIDNIAVIAPAFSADCIETLEEINEEIGDAFKDAGGKAFTYIPCLNDRDDHMKALMGIIENEAKGWLG
ncbi:MAG: ferrochelatase [Rhodobacteraceae bacterium]|nr:ferrochelatase [Paracoccaceae bacterium]